MTKNVKKFKQVANYMLNELTTNGVLYQNEIVYIIADKFGEEFVYNNERGNLAIEKKVLDIFKKIRPKEIVWDQRERCWR